MGHRLVWVLCAVAVACRSSPSMTASGTTGSGGASSSSGVSSAAASSSTSASSTSGGCSSGTSSSSSGGTCSGGAAWCGGTCTDLQTDAANCGACGHGCLGATCVEGACKPALLTTATSIVSSLAVDGTSVFYAVESSGIEKMSNSGGTSTLIVTTAALVTGLSVDATNLYWSAQNLSPASIMRAAKDGTGVTTLASAPGVIGASRLTIDASFAYYPWHSPLQLRKVPLAGGAVVTLALIFPSVSVAVDSTNAYWGDLNADVWSVPLGGGSQKHLASIAGCNGSAYVAADGCSVFYGCFGPGPGIWSVPASGGPQAMLATTVGAVGGILADASHVYWAESNGGPDGGAGNRIMRVAKDGTGPLQLATSVSPQYIALDSQFLYWSDAANNVYRVAK